MRLCMSMTLHHDSDYSISQIHVKDNLQTPLISTTYYIPNE